MPDGPVLIVNQVEPGSNDQHIYLHAQVQQEQHHTCSPSTMKIVRVVSCSMAYRPTDTWMHMCMQIQSVLYNQDSQLVFADSFALVRRSRNQTDPVVLLTAENFQQNIAGGDTLEIMNVRVLARNRSMCVVL